MTITKPSVDLPTAERAIDGLACAAPNAIGPAPDGAAHA